MFVLGDSGEPKDTKKILSRVKDGVLRAQSLLAAKYPDFSLHSTSGSDLERYADDLTRDELELLRGTLRNRDITLEAERVLRTTPLDHEQIGALLDAHQAVLREVLRISTVKIDAMIDAAREAGALGGKINGSGGGGCMFAYAPTDPESVAGAIRRAGGRAYVVRSDAGTRAEPCGSGS